MDLMHELFNIVLPPINIILILCFLPPYLVFKILYYIKRHISIENVAGKVVLITGAAKGIGEQLAYEYARRGACLVLVDIKEDRLGPVVNKARQLGSPDVISIGADVSNIEDSQRFIEGAINHFGRLDHLVNNAGVGTDSITNDNVFIKPRRVMEINYWGTVYSTHFAIPHLSKSKGKIMVTASGLGWFPTPKTGFYGASKAAVINYYESLRSEIGCDIGITIVTPGLIKTDMSDELEKNKGVNLIVPLESKESCAKAMVNSVCRGDKYLVEPSWIRILFSWKVFYPEIVEFGNHWAIFRNRGTPKKSPIQSPEAKAE
ncbi:11-beta-hydroxysteroid dehydrogenase-like 4A [Ricinus communis]|uniref:Corticosteroid 11-beta-dehydrogenase, putative n=1 Tax=Ricinus communis TaxID=3988 RepID=B9RAB9_RICCO|nr:11-beta-hydroxysteroid dehydrogenase-like 4A [Ricinus communis]EEF51746.1 Corticosteroid 11-beta-dehydrogenase, putative [Ricinus communis]|eukprot:XP_002511144.1 11-beta-hydroxysteroid dehydrogenase-like 4A [Ricinus communis]